MAAGEMDVDRPVERDARLAPARDLLGVALGVGGRELAAGIAGAGDEAGADRARLGRQARAPRSRPRRAPTLSVGTPEISRFCQTVSRISPSPRSRAIVGEPAHLRRGELADRQHDADPVAARPASADARRYGRRGRTPAAARRLGAATRVELAAELFLDQRQELLEAQARRARISAAPCCGRCGRRGR